MDGTVPVLPPAHAGYRVVDLEAFVAAAEERIAILKATIAEARARPIIDVSAIDVEARHRVAADWLEASRIARAIRSAADADAAAVLRHAMAFRPPDVNEQNE